MNARKTAFVDPNYRLPPKPIELCTQIYPNETEALHIDSLKVILI